MTGQGVVRRVSPRRGPADLPALLELGWCWAGALGRASEGPPGPGLVPGPGTFISRAFLSLFRSMRHSSDMHFSRLAARWRYSIS